MYRSHGQWQKPLFLRFTIEIPRPNIEVHSLMKWCLPFIIIFVVIIFNLPYLFSDMLWHDDGQWYYRATEGIVMDLPWRGKIASLSPYLDYFYSHGMVNLGLPLTRGIFAFVMALASLLIYYLYHNIFGIDSKISLTAAVIPNILPSLRGIPIGLNASYAVWGLVPLLASLLIITKTFKKEGVLSLLYFCVAFGTYIIGLNLPGQPSSNFLIPYTLLFILMFIPINKRRSAIYTTTFLLYGGYKLYQQCVYTHRAPTILSLDEIFSRICQFFEMASFLPFNQSYSLYITVSLATLGCFGLIHIHNNSMLYRTPSHFKFRSNIYRFLLAGLILSWMVFNSFAYVAASDEFRAHDYAYIFNFGAVLLQVNGIVYLIILANKWCLQTKYFHSITAILLFFTVVFVGIQRIHYKNHSWGWKRWQEKTSQVLRENLSTKSIPINSQVMVLGEKIGISYNTGLLWPNTGYIRYLLGRKDLHALIGPDRYPGNVFAPWGGFFKPMRGFSIDKPLIGFRKNGDTLSKVELLLQVLSTGRKELPRLEWNLYDIQIAESSPIKIASGNGLSSYFNYINYEIPNELKNADIAFGPQSISDEIISIEQSEKLMIKNGLLNDVIKYGNCFTVNNVFVFDNNINPYLQIFVQVNKIPEGAFSLAYTINSNIHPVALWNFIMEGDTILITTPPINEKKLIHGISIGLINIGRYPNIPLTIDNGPLKGKQFFQVELHTTPENRY